MPFRTDLAVELLDGKTHLEEREKIGDVNVSKINIKTEEGEKLFGRKKGNYITLEFPDLEKTADSEDIEKAVKKALFSLLPESFEKILVVGLGNSEITPDSVGPITASNILATRHIAGEFSEKIGLKGLKSVSVITPNVLGKTGLEAAETVSAVKEKTKPDTVIVVDALAAGSISRLFKTIQLTDTGISPGSGVKNSRKELSEESLGVPVIAIGVPTVVDAGIIGEELGGKANENTAEIIFTPKDCDILCKKISEILSRTINITIQPEIEPEIILSLV